MFHQHLGKTPACWCGASAETDTEMRCITADRSSTQYAVSFLDFPRASTPPLKMQAEYLQYMMQALLGDLPTLQYGTTSTLSVPSNIAIAKTSTGVAEVQKVVISSDAGFVREVQSLTLSGATAGTFDITLSDASNSVSVTYDASAADLEVQ